jgi:uncharacterized protein
MQCKRGMFLTAALVTALAGQAIAEETKSDKIRVVIIDGQNNHNWRATTPFLRKVLLDSGRFTVDVSSNLKKDDKPGSVGTVPFPPDLGKYDVVVSNYNGASWPKDFNESFDTAIKSGKLGLVIVHAANNAFAGWEDYNKMIGLGWRAPKQGDALKFDESGKETVVPKGDGAGSGHGAQHEFTITIRDSEHPVTKGMPKAWLHTRDELYQNLRGPHENMHLLATAYSRDSKAHEPMIWTIDYGKGRVFHTPMGHELVSMRDVGFVTTLLRGTEWAATGKVTIPIPENFPTEKKTSPVAEK